MKKLITSEAVTIGHPDKVCDQISDAILDAYLESDENARVACEVSAHKEGLLIMGEITSFANINIEEIVRQKLKEIGYDNDILHYNADKLTIDIKLHRQSPDINIGVDMERTIGAGDQGMMFGYATDETENYMPIALTLANNLARELERARKEKIIPYLRPDGKTQVTIEYDDNHIIRVDTIVVSSQTDEVPIEEIRNDIKEKIIKKIIPNYLIDDNTNIYINPTGRFILGGPVADSGLTGRKIITDTYGSAAHHGGGAFSGKDYTKVDRSAAYYARYVAKNLVAAGVSNQLEVSVSYAIGINKPLAININTFNTNKILEENILDIINNIFDFSPSNIIKELDLKHVKYSDTTCYSHFGKNNLPWEQLDKVEQIKNILNNLN